MILLCAVWTGYWCSDSLPLFFSGSFVDFTLQKTWEQTFLAAWSLRVCSLFGDWHSWMLASEHERYSWYVRCWNADVSKINHTVTLLLLGDLLGVSLTHSKTKNEGKGLLREVWAGQPDLSAGTSQACSAMSCHSLGGTRHLLKLWLVMCLSPDHPDVNSLMLFTHEELENPGAAVFGKITPLLILWCWRSTWRQSSKFHLLLVEINF